MQFSTRNAFYLRVSNYRVIPLFLYLDERHVDWMEDRVLQLVMSELQSKLPPLLTNSRNEKKHKVHVERGEGYQYCYFLRTTTRTEVVLLKNKSYSLRPPTPPPESTPLREQTPKRSRTRSTSTTTRPRSTPTKRARSSRSTSVRSDAESIGSPPLVSEEVVQVKDEREETPEVEERGIKDWKPDVDVTFKGFGTSSVQLVLIIEPYPPLPQSEYAPPSSRLSSRSTSIAASRSRSRHLGTGRSSSTSLSLSVAPGASASSRQQSHTPNMRNASRSVSALPRGTSSTPFGREDSSTPGPGGTSGRRRRTSQTPLFMRDTTVDDDEEDEEQHQLYTQALREGRLRLPSVSRPAGGDMGETASQGRRSVRRGIGFDDDDEDEDDMPETLEAMSQRLVRSSEIEEGVTRVQGGWEERVAGEESAVMGREEPGD